MKTLLLTVVALFTLSLAQAQVANFDTKTTKTKLDDASVQYTFTVDGLNGNQKEIGEKFRAHKGITDVKLVGSTYTVTLPKTNNKETLQAMLLAAGINSTKVDGKSVPTGELLQYIKDQKSTAPRTSK
jgi:hypothetical protein